MTETTFEPRDDEMFFNWTDKNGKEQNGYNEEWMLAKLLIDAICFVNTRVYVEIKCDTKTGKWNYDYELYKSKKYNEDDYKTTVIFVNCSDVWFCGADAEPIMTTELPELYKMHMADKKWGSIKWACRKRNSQPQMPIIKDMKRDGAWDDSMETLPKNKAA